LQLEPFDDVLTLQVWQPSLNQPHYAYTVVWTGADVYTLQGGGVAAGTTSIALLMNVSHTTEFFGGNPLVRLDAVLDMTASPVQGPWGFQSLGLNEPFVNSGTLVQVACGSALARRTSEGLAGAWE
jgi:hypothetical protein